MKESIIISPIHYSNRVIIAVQDYFLAQCRAKPPPARSSKVILIGRLFFTCTLFLQLIFIDNDLSTVYSRQVRCWNGTL